jgi:hypothetical protein
MRIPTVITYFILALSLQSCDQQPPVSGVDQELGRACFESQRASLPPGTQYEGVAKITDNNLSIKIMNGVDVVMIHCALNANGTLKNDSAADTQ